MITDTSQFYFVAEDRGFGYLRVTTGDELSKRAKFVFISWCGNEVGGLKRAKLGTDKASLKQILQVGRMHFITLFYDSLSLYGTLISWKLKSTSFEHTAV